MRSVPKPAVLASLGALLVVLLMGCGQDRAPGEAANGAAGAGTDAPAEPAGGSGDDAAPAECAAPEGLLTRLGQQRQLVLNVALAKGENLEAVQSASPLEPETFRSVADLLDGLALSGIASAQFDRPEEVVADLRQTADLLQAALAAGTDPADPAWQRLAEFFTQEFFARHSASVNYYLSEAGCL